jgi:two-component system phosphate regulon response regulator PhoB
MAGEKILVVEDEPDILLLLQVHLEQAGYEVKGVETGAQALEALRKGAPDVLILDLMLPDLSGTEVLRVIREEHQTKGLPVLILTARTDEVDRVVGFELGADDYITKPFSPREVVLRVRAVLRRVQSRAESDHQRMVHHEIDLDLERHRCQVNHQNIELTATEFSLLRTLMEHPGRVYSRERLLEHAWGSKVHVTLRTVDTHVKRLRQKLGPAGERIATVRGVGYRIDE